LMVGSTVLIAFMLGIVVTFMLGIVVMSRHDVPKQP
jgi:hypothetical protein